MPQAGRYTLVTGHYQIRHAGNGSQPRPDGDTVQFVIDSPATILALRRFAGTPPKLSVKNVVSLRLEVIDALETHFPTQGAAGGGASVETHQQLALANEARAFLLKSLGFKNVVFDARGVVTSADAFQCPGYVLANGVEANGRIVSLLYTGKPPEADGTQVRVTPGEMTRSVNLASLKKGLSYATLYSSMPHELILVARAVAAMARKKGLGVFGAEDVGTHHSKPIKGLDELQKLVMLPKLFRRLADFFVQTDGKLAGFDAWVRQTPRRDDKIWLPTGEVGNLHDCYVVKAGKLSLVFEPEDLQVAE